MRKGKSPHALIAWDILEFIIRLYSSIPVHRGKEVDNNQHRPLRFVIQCHDSLTEKQITTHTEKHLLVDR